MISPEAIARRVIHGSVSALPRSVQDAAVAVGLIGMETQVQKKHVLRSLRDLLTLKNYKKLFNGEKIETPRHEYQNWSGRFRLGEINGSVLNTFRTVKEEGVHRGLFEVRVEGLHGHPQRDHIAAALRLAETQVAYQLDQPLGKTVLLKASAVIVKDGLAWELSAAMGKLDPLFQEVTHFSVRPHVPGVLTDGAKHG